MENKLRRPWYRFSLLLISIIYCLSLTSCGDDEKNDPDAYKIDIRGYWVCDSKELALEIISADEYYQLTGKLSNHSSTDNVYQLWSISNNSPQCWLQWTTQVKYFLFQDPDYNWRDKVYVSSYTNDLLFLDGLDSYCFHRISKNEFSNLTNQTNNNTESGNQSNATKELLCRNGGVWKYENNYTYDLSGNTQYCKHSEEFDFTENGTILVQAHYERSGKSYSGYSSVSSDVLAIGSYQINGNTLKCEFVNVTCSGSSDIVTRYWNQGVTNNKSYTIKYYPDDNELHLEDGDEKYYLTKYNGSNSGSSGGSSDGHHYPCKSCNESGDCWNCNGSGKNSVTNKPCNTCNGTGKCQTCNGKGYIIV